MHGQCSQKQRLLEKEKREPEELDGVPECGSRVGGSQSTRRKPDGWLTEVKMVKEWSGTRLKKDMKSGDRVLALIYCYDRFPHSLNMAPKQQTWAQLMSWPPSHQVCLRQMKLIQGCQS